MQKKRTPEEEPARQLKIISYQLAPMAVVPLVLGKLGKGFWLVVFCGWLAGLLFAFVGWLIH